MRSVLSTAALLVGVLAALFASPAARADYYYEFANTSGVATNNFTISGVGGTVQVEVLLVQTGSGTSNALASEGLISGAVQLNTATPSAATVTAVSGNSAFTNITTQTGSNASVNEYTLGNPVMASTNSILLGTFTFTGVTAGQSTLSTTSLLGSGSDNTLADGTSIDNLISNSSAIIAVNAVPEPSTLLLGGLLATGIAARRLRRNTIVAA
jgi:hypothetical protein